MINKKVLYGLTKVLAAALIVGSVGVCNVSNAYAYTPSSSTINQLGVKVETIEVKTICEAKALEAELRRDGIKANLTLNCASQDIVNYFNQKLVSIPVATLYESVKVKLASCTQNNNCQNNTQNNNCQNNTQNNNCQNNTQNNNCQNNTQNNNCQNNTQNNNCQNNTTQAPTVTAPSEEKKEDKKEETVTVTEEKKEAGKVDEVPATGDESNLALAGGLVLIYGALTVVLYLKKKKIV